MHSKSYFSWCLWSRRPRNSRRNWQNFKMPTSRGRIEFSSGKNRSGSDRTHDNFIDRRQSRCGDAYSIYYWTVETILGSTQGCFDEGTRLQNARKVKGLGSWAPKLKNTAWNLAIRLLKDSRGVSELHKSQRCGLGDFESPEPKASSDKSVSKLFTKTGFEIRIWRRDPD